MRRRRTRLVQAVLVAAVVAVFLSPVLAQPGASATFLQGLLFLVDDESSLEKQIGQYLQTVHGYAGVESRAFDGRPDDLFVVAPVSAGAAPGLVVRVDTFPTNGTRQGRSIRIYAWYVLPDSAKTPQALDRLLELNNKYHNVHYPTRFCIDGDGDILMEQWITISKPAVPVHAELVVQGFLQMARNWETYWGDLKSEFNL